jgi:hypothetical protein
MGYRHCIDNAPYEFIKKAVEAYNKAGIASKDTIRLGHR